MYNIIVFGENKFIAYLEVDIHEVRAESLADQIAGNGLQLRHDAHREVLGRRQLIAGSQVNENAVRHRVRVLL